VRHAKLAESRPAAGPAPLKRNLRGAGSAEEGHSKRFVDRHDRAPLNSHTARADTIFQIKEFRFAAVLPNCFVEQLNVFVDFFDSGGRRPVGAGGRRLPLTVSSLVAIGY
jgi:hypothetical protein